MQRVVSRSDLVDVEDGSQSSSGAELEKLPPGHIDFIERAATEQLDNGKADRQDELDFFLFAPSKTTIKDTNQRTTKITLRSPSVEPLARAGRMVERDQSYYFADPLTVRRRSDLAATALTGEEVIARASSACPGNKYPWKVLCLPSASQNRAVQLAAPSLFAKLTGYGNASKRTRPGKKYRIKLRTKLEARERDKVAAKAAADAKEAAEQEKRTRRNREKKVKKRLRDKAKKANAGATHDVPNKDDDDEDP